jgi:outer membrane lipoprotein-sorting protein
MPQPPQAVTMLSAEGHKDAGRRVRADSDAMTRLASRRLRWLLPAGIAAAIAVASVATTAAANASGPPPKLAAKTAAQLLVAVENASPAGLSGTIVETAKLGLPDISGLLGSTGGSGVSIETLVTGSNTMNVWYAGQDKQRFALLGQLSEDDLIHNGTDLWSYDSSSRTVTHKTLTPDAADQVGSIASSAPSLDPQTAAEKALAAIDPTTLVVVDRTARVAGRAAYQLQLSPRDTRSLIGSVQIAIDAATSVPLRVQIFAAGATSPAFQVGFTSVSFNVPNSSIFEFVPPAGATVEQDTAPFGDSLSLGGLGGDGGYVVRTRASGKDLSGKGVDPNGTLATPAPPLPTNQNSKRNVTELGKGWTEVVKITNAVPALPANVPAPNGPLSSSGPLASDAPQIRVQRSSPLDDIATQVPGGELITTALASIFIANDGTLYIGPVSAADIQKVASSGQGL